MATRITAIMLAESRTYVTMRFGAERWSQMLDQFQDKTKNLYSGPLTPSTWVDFAEVADLLGTIDKVLSSEGDGQLHQLGLHNAEANLRVTQKLIMRVLTIKMVLKLASFLWTGRVQQGGRMVVENTGPKSVRARIEEPPDVSILWWTYLAGWFQRTIELAGGRNVKSKYTGGGEEKGQAAHFEVSWS